MKRLTLIALVLPLLTGCAASMTKMPELPSMSMPSWPSFLTPSWPSIDLHEPTIIQGSVLEVEDVEQLQIGMSKDAVMELIGSPSIIDAFHKDQWDYIQHSTISGKEVIHYRLTLIFDGNLLSTIDTSDLGGLRDVAE